MVPNAKSNHYFEISYDSKERFVSYWHQINELVKLRARSYLEIGIGNSLVANYLRQRGFNVTTMDIDPYLTPDLLGSVAKIPFTNESFDVVACFELLEHLPYEQLIPMLQEIRRVSKKFVVLSLPDANRVLRFYVHLPKIGELKKFIPLPRLKPLKHEFNGKHYWEIGKEEFPLHRIISDVERAGFYIKKTYRVFGIPYHRFFILTK